MEKALETEFLQVISPTQSWSVKASSSDEKYSILTDGQLWSCTCPGYFYRGYCKHITSVKEQSAVK
jgi:uncharacterized Zn finger protein